LENLKIPPFYLEKKPNFSLPCHPRNKPLGLIPIPKKFTSPNPLKKPPLGRGGIAPSSPSHPTKTLLEKKRKNSNPLFLFLKAPFITCNSFNKIELSTPYTH
jgi:hypothetical protein